MVYLILINLFCVLLFLFVLWKKLKDDYIPNQIFSCAFLSLIGILLLNIVSKYFLPTWWFWLSFAGFILGSAVGVIKFRLKVFEYLDSITTVLLFWVSLIFLENAVANQNWYSFVLFVVSILCVTVYFLINKYYRKFSWYRSGRIGFSGLVSMAFYFLLRAVLAVFFPFMLSFVGSIEIYLSSLVSFVLFLLIVNLTFRNQ